jgi:hypothetical protein
LKDAARLLTYFAATLLFGALAAPLLYFAGHFLSERSILFLSRYDFETFFHRALLFGAIVFLWPLLRSLGIRRWSDLGLKKNRHSVRDVSFGFVAAAIPLLIFGFVIVALGVYALRPAISPGGIAGRCLPAIIVPFIEEPLFRGLILGVLLRGKRYNRRYALPPAPDRVAPRARARSPPWCRRGACGGGEPRQHPVFRGHRRLPLQARRRAGRDADADV